jgi:fructose-1,6-bisphosphatase/sedoheptulose 1,7-bisphosphatase-like protein
MHQESKCHKDALLKSSNFMQIMIAGEEKNIKCSISKSYEDNIKNNQEIILNFIDVIVVIGQHFEVIIGIRSLNVKMEILTFWFIGKAKTNPSSSNI